MEIAMTHRSRLAGFIIDCKRGTLAKSADFWSQALGLPVADDDEGNLGIYAPLADGPGGLHIEVQKVGHPSRVHLDIESDDVEAEVARLERLGAKRIDFVRERWWVMEAPTGHRFCVVPMPAKSGRGKPNVWK
jgi:predicted enzyme related to lactoylglutathione lyase